MLILVRHALPAASPDVPPDEWELSDEGRDAAAMLVASLPAGAILVASAEPKAWMTLGDKLVIRDPRFGEVRRPVEPWSDDFRAVRAAYVRGEVHDGWEPHADVAERFEAGLDAHRPDDDGAALVIGTHGMAMTTWLVAGGIVSPTDAPDFWADLRFPDALVVDLANGTVERYNVSA